MRSEYSGPLLTSGYSGAEAIVGARHACAWAGNSRGTENKVRVGIDIASIDVDHIGPLDERFAVLESQFDAVFPGFDLECEAAGHARRAVLALAGGDVHDLDGAASDR